MDKEALKPACSTCRHWDRDVDDWEAKKAGFGLCRGVRERWKITESAWCEDGLSADAREEAIGAALKAAGACVQDGSEYMAELLTGPEFRCALYFPALSQGEER